MRYTAAAPHCKHVLNELFIVYAERALGKKEGGGEGEMDVVEPTKKKEKDLLSCEAFPYTYYRPGFVVT